MPRHVVPTPFIVHPPGDLFRAHHDLRRLSHTLGEKYASNKVTDTDLRIMGSQLWNLLNLDASFDSACKSAGSAILPIMIESSAADVQVLPWETLYHPKHGFLGKHNDFTLTRQMEPPQDSSLQLEKGPLRVLLFTALPEAVNPGTGRLNIEKEQLQVQEVLFPWIAKGQVQLEMPDDGRFSTLKELLKGFQPHILFLSGHGHFYHAPHADEAYGEFFFESETGDSEAVNEDEIANALIGINVQAVVLSACESGKAAPDALSNGLIRKISAQGAPHVIGMRESISDTSGIDLVSHLCNALAEQEYIDVAIQSARIGIAKTDRQGQWCLPILISSKPDMPLIDWDFQPDVIDAVHRFKNTIGNVRLPERFVGRRAELRRFKNELFQKKIHKLLITGPGGQGKTSLAGKLALDLQKRGWQVFAWSAKQNDSWRTFELELEQALTGPRIMRYNRLPGAAKEYERARLMLDLLMEQFDRQVVIVLDNLESIQDPNTQALNDPLIADWMKAALETPELILLATSRWMVPDWDGSLLELAGTSYGDFLQLAQGFGLPSTMLETRGGLRHVHEVLGGNSRGLEFFAAAVRSMQNPDEEHALLAALAKAKEDLQADMAIAEIYQRLPTAAQKLLRRLPVYHEAVPLEGFIRLGPDLPGRQKLLEQLLGVSLLEASNVQHRNLIQYQCSPLVRDWLEKQKLNDDHPNWLSIAATYYFDLFLEDRRALPRAIAAYHALRRAQLHADADRLAWSHIIGPLTQSGSYASLLKEWLPPLCRTPDVQMRGRALAHNGLLLKNIGEYAAALEYLDQALTLQRKILDQAGEAKTLNYIGMTYQRQGEYEKALTYLEQALSIQRQIGDRKGEARTLSNVAQIYYRQGEYEKASAYMKQTLAIQQQTGDPNQSAALNDISQVLKAQGDYETALEYLGQALVIQQQFGDKPGESITLNNISGIYQRWNHYETALKYLKQALAVQRQIRNRLGEAITLGNISGIYHRQGEFDTALKYLSEAWDIQKQIGDKAGQGMTLNNLASVYQARGEHEIALSNYRQALDIQRELHDQAGESQTLNNLGTFLQTQGDYETALENFERARFLAKKMGSKAGESTTLNNIGTVLQVQGKYQAALENFEHTLTLKREIGDRIGEAATLNNIGTVYEAQGDDQAALSAYNQALAIRRQIKDLEGEAQSLNNLSKLHRTPGDYQTALKYLELARTIQEQIDVKPGLCITFLNLGLLHSQNKNVEEAKETWLDAYQLARDMKLKQVLQELEKLAPTIGLQKGLEDWEALTQKKKNKEDL